MHPVFYPIETPPPNDFALPALLFMTAVFAAIALIGRYGTIKRRRLISKYNLHQEVSRHEVNHVASSR